MYSTPEPTSKARSEAYDSRAGGAPCINNRIYAVVGFGAAKPPQPAENKDVWRITQRVPEPSNVSPVNNGMRMI